VGPARQGTLIMNLKSGGGKAERFHLEDECRRRGIEPVVLRPGDDLLQLAHDAIDRGTDVIGMAGGDGSQALVASVAAERGVPMVVIPAGTRNHFALDIGIDRGDVVGALEAYGEARERTIDLADVNGRVFVNNVSLGLYATIVRSPEYRDAKRETTLAALPAMLGPQTEPFDLRFTTPDGVAHEGAHVIQVSNGPYGTTVAGITSRPRLDTGLLGIFSLVVPDAVSATRAVAALTTAHPQLYPGYLTWSAPTFEVTSASPIAVGLDGESLAMDPPLVFSSRPGVLRLRLPPGAIGYSPAARAVGVRALPDLWRVAIGRPVAIGDRPA
jgi:diacylglycerol kinase family enzyme